ncbi:MAG: ATP-binding cassette domain-containing protein [Ignavibacteria bacterium]|nr:ATP-binding cassette domain-containing protein [Ignavibacteria bacterium]
MNNQIILRLKDISFEVKVGNSIQKILNNVNLEIYKSEIFGLTGESGSGKTTIGKIISGLEKPTAGKKYFYEKEFIGIEPEHKIQFLFQNYTATHDPLQKIDKAFNEILKLKKEPSEIWFHSKKEILNLVGLSDEVLVLYPSQLSGGQLQRLALAKLLILKPDLLILDEPFASQDVASILNLLKLFQEINQRYGTTFLIISHELPYLLKIANRIGFIKDGEIIEIINIDRLDGKRKIPKPSSKYAEFLFQSFGIKTF